MSSIGRVLVAVDLSPSSFDALDYAVVLRTRWGATIDVLLVWEGSLRPSAWDAFDYLRGLEAQGALQISGCLSRAVTGGTTLARIAAEGCHALLVDGTRDPWRLERRFVVLQGVEPRRHVAPGDAQVRLLYAVVAREDAVVGGPLHGRLRIVHGPGASEHERIE